MNLKLFLKGCVFAIAISFVACFFVQSQVDSVYAESYQDPLQPVEYTFEYKDDHTVEITKIEIDPLYEDMTVIVPEKIRWATISEVIVESTNCINLDFSQAKNLERVSLDHCHIKKLNLSGLKNLKSFDCVSDLEYNENTLQSLNLSGCSNLLSASIFSVGLEKINLKGCKSLQYLRCNGSDESYYAYDGLCKENNLTKLNLDSCTDLRYLNCSINLIRSLDLSKCKRLEELYCYCNCLESLNLKNNKKLKVLGCSYNNLQRIALPAKIKLKGNCRHNFLKRKPTLQMIKHMGTNRVIPQDKISKNSVGKVFFWRGSKEGVKKINLQFGSDGHVTRYQIQVKKKGASKWNTYNISPAHRKTIKNLKSGKKYLVRVRAQLKVDNKWYTGTWSQTWKCTVK